MGSEADMQRSVQCNKECGNLVSLLHDNKWVTEYCHMKKGSVAVTIGQQVMKGDKLGQVGQSGMAEFPHLHFVLKENNSRMDPFTGLPLGDCTAKGRQMWDSPLPYDPAKIVAAGFTAGAPDFSAILSDAASTPSLSADGAGLVFWALMYGTQKGDIISLEVRGPDGKSFASATDTPKHDKIRYFRFTGRKNSGKPLATGVYTATVTPKRGDLERRKQSSVMVK